MVDGMIAIALQSGTTYDMPKDLYFGGNGASQIQPLALAIFLIAAILILVLPRKYVIGPLLATGLLLSMGNGIVVAGVHVLVCRLLLLVGWIRVARDVQSEHGFYPKRWTPLDKVFFFWTISNAITFCLLWGQFAAVVNRLGFLYTTLGAYFLIRHLIRDKEDVVLTVKVLAILTVVMAVFMLSEHITGHNLFSLVGGPDLASVRDGKIRAQGPFAHSIIAGTIGAMLMPLFVGLWWQGRKYRLIAGLGIAGGAGMAIASASSTPVMTYLFGALALLLWSARKKMKRLRWGIVISLVALQLVMKAPVWFLLARLGGLMGGSGWHRAVLIDSFVQHFWQWWLVGTQSNANWGYDMWDAINAYVGAGVEGGLVTFILFIAVVVYAFKRVGISRKMAEKYGFLKEARLAWAMGAALLANTVAFFGIAYFDQSIFAWYTLLAMTSATTTFVANKKPAQPQPRIAEATTAAFAAGTVPAEAPVGSRQTFASLLK